MEFIFHEDNCYKVIRKLPLRNFIKKDKTPNQPWMEAWRIHFGADIMFFNENEIIFALKVKDADESPLLSNDRQLRLAFL